MTRAHHVTHSYTAERIIKVRCLVAGLQMRKMSRDEIGAMLKLGPSGVRKYLADLRDLVEQGFEAGQMFVRLSASPLEVQAYLARLTTQALPRRPRKSDLSQAALDPSRRFHILADDEHFAIRVQRGIPAHDPLHAAFFHAGGAEARA